MPAYKIRYKETIYREVTVRALSVSTAEELVEVGLISGHITNEEVDRKIVEVEEVEEAKLMPTGLTDSKGDMIYVGERVLHSKLGSLKVDFVNGSYQCFSNSLTVQPRELRLINKWVTKETN